MASDPERPIEKLLRDYAERRRRQSNVSLHPATRRLLQGEVRRRYANAAQGGAVSARFRFWRRLGWASAGAACLAVAAAIWFGSGKTSQHQPLMMVQNQPATSSFSGPLKPDAALGLAPAEAPALERLAKEPSAELASSAAISTQTPPLAPAPASPGTQADRAAAVATLAGARWESQSRDLPGQAGRTLSNAGYPTQGIVLWQSGQNGSENFIALQPNAQSAKAELTPAATTTSTIQAKAAGAVSQMGTQLFRRTAPQPVNLSFAADSLTPASRVLTSFQVEQAGQVLRIIDQDGSQYIGQWQAPIAPAQPTESAPLAGIRSQEAESRRAPALRQRLQPVPAATGRFFRVSGTNLSLGKPVVFNGSFVPLTNATGSGSQALEGRISGTVRVAGQKEFELKAVPAGR